MKSSRLLLAVTTLAFLLTLAVSTATAGSMGNGAAQRQKLVIESIDVTTGTVEFKSGVDNTIHTYKIDATTRVRIVNNKGTIDQIKVGQQVFNYTVKGGQTPVEGQTLAFIGVSPAAPVPVPPANP
jgi:multidrug efflux pump subunit AcrA (membrane-fusion protein)